MITPALVSPNWLADNLEDPSLRLLDASWSHPRNGVSGHEQYLAAHIPGARFFDIDQVADKTRPLPHMAPSVEFFAQSVGALGVGSGNHVVVYDRSFGVAAAARVWWSFRLFGHNRVSVLDGGLDGWAQAGLPIAAGAEPPLPPAGFNARLRPDLIRDKAAVATAAATGREQIVDARSPERFAGTGDEPWPHIKRGHIPGSLNLPWERLIEDGRMKSPPAIRSEFERAGVALSVPLIATCGSGVTASFLVLGAFIAGATRASLYDGSWAEWGNDPDTPVATGKG